jgi:hypothetical protein
MIGRTKGYGGAILLSTGIRADDGRRLTDENWQKIGTDRLLAINCGEVIVRSDPI